MNLVNQSIGIVLFVWIILACEIIHHLYGFSQPPYLTYSPSPLPESWEYAPNYHSCCINIHIESVVHHSQTQPYTCQTFNKLGDAYIGIMIPESGEVGSSNTLEKSFQVSSLDIQRDLKHGCVGDFEANSSCGGAIRAMPTSSPTSNIKSRQISHIPRDVKVGFESDDKLLILEEKWPHAPELGDLKTNIESDDGCSVLQIQSSKRHQHKVPTTITRKKSTNGSSSVSTKRHSKANANITTTAHLSNDNYLVQYLVHTSSKSNRCLLRYYSHSWKLGFI